MSPVAATSPEQDDNSEQGAHTWHVHADPPQETETKSAATFCSIRCSITNPIAFFEGKVTDAPRKREPDVAARQVAILSIGALYPCTCCENSGLLFRHSGPMVPCQCHGPSLSTDDCSAVAGIGNGESIFLKYQRQRCATLRAWRWLKHLCRPVLLQKGFVAFHKRRR